MKIALAISPVCANRVVYSWVCEIDRSHPRPIEARSLLSRDWIRAIFRWERDTPGYPAGGYRLVRETLNAN